MLISKYSIYESTHLRVRKEMKNKLNKLNNFSVGNNILI